MAGWVSTVTATTVLTEPLDQTTVDNYASDLAELYGVDLADVEVATSYTASGSMSISIPSDVSETDLIDTVTTSIAESLGVHPSEVEVTIDMETGSVDFTIVADNFSEAAGIQFDLENDQYQDEIIGSIETALPEISVEEYGVSDEVAASIEFTIDADDADNDLTQAAWQSEQLLSEFDVIVESGYVTHAPTLIPTQKPTTSLPSAAPTMTGTH